MKQLWNKLTRVQKVIGSIIATIAGVIMLWQWGFSSYTHFATRAYADNGDTVVKVDAQEANDQITHELHEYQLQQVISNNRAEIWRAKREINRLTDELAEETSESRKVRLQADVAEYKGLITCIQDDKELCY